LLRSLFMREGPMPYGFLVVPAQSAGCWENRVGRPLSDSSVRASVNMVLGQHGPRSTWSGGGRPTSSTLRLDAFCAAISASQSALPAAGKQWRRPEGRTFGTRTQPTPGTRPPASSKAAITDGVKVPRTVGPPCSRRLRSGELEPGELSVQSSNQTILPSGSLRVPHDAAS
jgi:hypothetical protein